MKLQNAITSSDTVLVVELEEQENYPQVGQIYSIGREEAVQIEAIIQNVAYPRKESTVKVTRGLRVGEHVECGGKLRIV